MLSVVIGLILLAFSWPSVTLAPKDLPIAVAGPAPQLGAVQAALDAQSEGAIRPTEVADRDAAVTAIQRREVYGAIILGPSPEVLTAGAASTATNQLMAQFRTQLQAMLQQQAAAQAQASGAAAPTVSVAFTDVVPLVENDARGTGLAAAAFPLVFGGMIGGIGVVFLIVGTWRRVLALLAYAVAAGLVITAVMQGWYQVLPGNFAVNAAAFALTVLAMGATIVGAVALLGIRGIAVGPVLFMLIANPISGAAFPKEFLPTPWGQVGQWFPPGAGATLIRDVAYFPDANAAFPWLVLAGWAAAGLALNVLGHYRNQPDTVHIGGDGTAPQPVPAPAAGTAGGVDA